jgi:hypothetical protein
MTRLCGGTLVGSIVATVMVDLARLKAALILAGLSLPLVILITLPKLRAMDRGMQETVRGTI